jgi:hypothetical protein
MRSELSALNLLTFSVTKKISRRRHPVTHELLVNEIDRLVDKRDEVGVPLIRATREDAAQRIAEPSNAARANAARAQTEKPSEAKEEFSKAGFWLLWLICMALVTTVVNSTGIDNPAIEFALASWAAFVILGLACVFIAVGKIELQMVLVVALTSMMPVAIVLALPWLIVNGLEFLDYLHLL